MSRSSGICIRKKKKSFIVAPRNILEEIFEELLHVSCLT